MSGNRYRGSGENALPLNQSGFTLVELMVAMVVGLFLVGGVASMYLSTLQSYFVLKDNAQVAQRERLAATFVGVVVQSAGYYNASTLTPAAAFPANNGVGQSPPSPFKATKSNGQFLNGSKSSYSDDGKSRRNDTLQLRMRLDKDGSVLHCLGMSSSAADDGLVFINRLTLDTDDHQLECQVVYRKSNGSYKSVDQPRPHPLLDGVESLEFTYGVDTDGDGSANQYQDADDVEIKQKWRSVRSIVMVIGFVTHNAATGNVNTTGEPVRFRAVFPVRPGMQ